MRLFNTLSRKSTTAHEVLRRHSVEIYETAHTNLLLQQRLASTRSRGKQNVLCIGDSHTRGYRIARAYVQDTRIATTVVRGATAYGLANKASETQSAAAFERAVRKASLSTPVVLTLGEVDCGSLVWRIARLRQQDPSAIMDIALQHLFDFIDSLERRLIISAVTPPTVQDYTRFEGTTNPRFGLDASWSDRNQMTIAWNMRLNEWSRVKGHTYLDTYTPTVWLGKVRQVYLPNDPSDHHLSAIPYGLLLADILPAAVSHWRREGS